MLRRHNLKEHHVLIDDEGFSAMKQRRPRSILIRCWYSYKAVFIIMFLISLFYIILKNNDNNIYEDNEDNNNNLDDNINQLPVKTTISNDNNNNNNIIIKEKNKNDIIRHQNRSNDEIKIIATPQPLITPKPLVKSSTLKLPSIKSIKEIVKNLKKEIITPKPKIIINNNNNNNNIWLKRREEVVNAFKHAWNAYKTYAWGQDILCPKSKRGESEFGSGLGLTLIDSLDTAYIMGLKKEVEEGKQWIAKSLDMNQPHEVNLFETTIRILGGLLSMYALTNDSIYLTQATAFGNKLMGAFEQSPTDIPYSDVFLQNGQGKNIAHQSSTSEVSTIQLEFRYLSFLTGNNKYQQRVDAVMNQLRNQPKYDGLVDIYVSPGNGKFAGGGIRLGSRGDSYYEYLLKQYIQTNYTEPILLNDYNSAIYGVKTHLVSRTPNDNLTFIGELPNGRNSGLTGKMDHLVCFLSGTLALGATIGQKLPLTKLARQKLNKTQQEDLKLAEELAYSCWQTYKRTQTGLAAEISHFSMNQNGFSNNNVINDKAIQVQSSAQHNLLRPETVESLYYMYHITGDVKYRLWGYSIFQSFEKYAKVSTGGYASLISVGNTDTTNDNNKRDKMESFFLAETLKYLYLLFSDDNPFKFDKWVFNTEAHPLPIFTWPKKK